MNAQSLSAPERGLVVLIGIALLATGVVFFAGETRTSAPPLASSIVLEDVVVVLPTFRDARKMDLNTASAAELVRLPGIGDVLASRIIAHRDEHGPFTSIDGLLAVSGIGPTVVEAIRDLVIVGEPGERPPDGQ